ncbi:MAG: alanine/glycine:cation symporter family protein [Planctomycetota bacterium]
MKLISRRFGTGVYALVAMLCFGPASGQEQAPEPLSERPAESAEDLPKVAEYVEPNDLGDVFNGVLGTINDVAYSTLFFDVAFGAFQETKTNEAGEVVLTRLPEMREVEAGFTGVRVDEAGALVLDDGGEPVRVEVAAGGRVQVISAEGPPVFVDGPPEVVGPTVPFLVIFLAGGAVYFTLIHGFINLRGFGHAVAVVRGKWSSGGDEGDLPPFRALTSALSATVGLGNIASVAVAMVAGGPGALLWMMVLGLFGMSSKFHESTLAQMYRVRNPDGSMSGGPMYYLDAGLRRVHPSLGVVGKPLAVVFAIFCMGAALGGGNMFQANQAYEGFFSAFVEPHVEADDPVVLREYLSYGFGLVMAAFVALVVIGGIGRIGAATSKIVPFMGVVYVTACAVIILFNAPALPGLIGLVFREAFAWDSAFGGLIGVMMLGFQRAAFSSEAGLGSSAIAHAAARTREPLREGLVAGLEPFIDTIVICCMTGLTVLITGAYLEEEGGSAVTLYAFQQVPALASWFPYILSVCIVLFAFSTMISWCYYGERAWGYLFGLGSVLVFRIAFVLCVFVGAVVSLSTVIAFADAMLLSMALPNIIGGVILAPQVRRRLKTYWAQYRSGELKPGESVAAIPRDDLGRDI